MSDPKPMTTLRGLISSCNVEFSCRLLSSHQADTLHFEHFVEVADALVGEDPRRAALHLAGLVALELAACERAVTRGPQPPPDGPKLN